MGKEAFQEPPSVQERFKLEASCGLPARLLPRRTAKDQGPAGAGALGAVDPESPILPLN